MHTKHPETESTLLYDVVNPNIIVTRQPNKIRILKRHGKQLMTY